MLVLWPLRRYFLENMCLIVRYNPHFAVRAAFSSGKWGHSVRNQVLYTHVPPVCWLPMFDKSRESKSVEVMKVWEVSDDRLRFMSADDSRTLRGAVESREISAAWEIWSYAAESSLIDAFCPSAFMWRLRTD